MNKPLIRLDETSAEQFANIPEAGMGYHVVEGSLRGENQRQLFIVTEGDLFAIPADHEEFFSRTDYFRPELPMERQTRWLENLEDNVVSRQLDIHSVTPLLNFALTPGYSSHFGAQPLNGYVTLQQPTHFYRFVWKQYDSVYDDRKKLLRTNTYLTTGNDRKYANTGYAAVGRYALPIPTPACHVFIYNLPKGTSFRMGTVCPNFGQAGGGVEIQLVKDTPVIDVQTKKIDAY